MTPKEIFTLMSIATANFPNLQEKDMRPTLTLWDKALSDMPYEVAEKAVIKVLSTSRFFPTVAEIREAAVHITQPRSLDHMEAWGLVLDAIRKYGYYREKEAIESLPQEVAEMVKQFTWRDLCLSETPQTLRAQFRMAWETRAKRTDELKQLPTEIRTMIEDVTKNMKLLN
jgi:hypothetical protein